VTFSRRNVAALTEEAAAEFVTAKLGMPGNSTTCCRNSRAGERCYALLVRGMKRTAAEEQATPVVAEVGLQQRAIIARANFPEASSKE